MTATEKRIGPVFLGSYVPITVTMDPAVNTASWTVKPYTLGSMGDLMDDAWAVVEGSDVSVGGGTFGEVISLEVQPSKTVNLHTKPNWQGAVFKVVRLDSGKPDVLAFGPFGLSYPHASDPNRGTGLASFNFTVAGVSTP